MTQNGKLLKEAMERLSNPKNTPIPRNKAGMMFMQNGGGMLKMQQGGQPIPTIEDAGNFIDGAWVPDINTIKAQAKKLGSKKVKTRSGSIIQFDKNWNVIGADDAPIMQNGGGLLSKSVTCSSCGHSWRSVDGGSDPLTCHNCGGIVKMQKGGQTRDEREMVNGIADILSQVNDRQNRIQIARQMVNDFNNEDVTYNYDKFMKMSKLAAGGMIKRADGSYSKRGLWDNIRANKGSGKKPTREMLEQERKIRSQEKSNGGPINNQNMNSIYDMMPHLAGGGTNNPGFEALPPYVQAKILSNMGYGGYYNPYMEAGGSTFSGNAFYGNGGYYPMYAEAGPVDPNGRWHGEWQDDPMLAEQFGYPAQGPSEDEIIAAQDAANVAASPMKPTKIKVDTPKALPGKKGQGSGSIVDFLNSQGAKSDFATRKAVAENVYGFGKYTGSPEQNKRLLAIMSGKEGYSKPQKGYNQNDGNMLRKGFDTSFDARSPQFGNAQQGSFDSGVPRGNFDSFDSRYPQFGSPRPGVPAQVDRPAAKQAAQSQKPGKRKPLFGKTADEFIAADPYFFAEESDGNFVKALDYPFTALRNAGARVVLDQDPMALFGLLAAGAGSRGLIGKTRTMPYNPRQIGPAGRMAGQKALPGRPTPTGWSTASGLRSGQYPMRAEGGYVEGQEVEITDPEQLRMLEEGGYTYEII